MFTLAPNIMRNSIIGIISILCLQISYQVFLAVDRTSLNYAAMSPVDAIGVERREVASLTDAPAAEADPDSLLRIRRTAAEPLRRTSSAERRRDVIAAKRPLPRSVDVETMDHFAVKTVHVRDMPREPIVQARPNQVSSHVETREKRSFFAKALPVIKKPYDWLKAVGSKIK